MNAQTKVRMNISLPKGLKRRMDRVRDNVNWSAIAATAFEREVRRLESTDKVKEKLMMEVAQRLRSSLQDDEVVAAGYGFEAGLQWAMHHASHPQLARIEEIAESSMHDGEWIGVPNAPWSRGDLVAMSILGIQPDSDSVRDELQDFYEGGYDDIAEMLHASDEAQVKGFVEGALDVFYEAQGLYDDLDDDEK